MSYFKDVVLVVARVIIGVIFIAHGWQKFTEWGLDGTAETFAGMGVPFPFVAATGAATAELLGGVALLIGALALAAASASTT
ncbi:DoxX family protein [Corynebacterium liangguodongii]|uniref:Uncharacterized protein n=1 Tax=Corynebacterium liangguodongii TaxID=2079535 RepID=A0A2S0WD53_9CORY|nr:DoxX family protein [Corynebacterium liangguodongii]AWB83698.1 hypothetical protein C3E79_03690 [Corynebacterium liangguodongii]PWB99492.1 DoxX family protein [Corynebacterium liangguodongii]